MMLNVVFGGKGVGFMNLIVYAMLAVFICGLMVGRTPEFLRRKIENEPLPNPERNKILLQFYSNFNRIKNFFDSRIWEEEERRNFKKLLTETCEEILKNIRK